MSSAAPQRARLPRSAPQLAQAALERARLTVVPRSRRRTRAPRVPFVTLVSTVLLGGVIGLLLFNTSMQQASFRQTALERQASDLSARQEALEMQLQDLRDPQRVAQRAQALGMVIPTTGSGILDLATGTVHGDPRPAGPEGRLPLVPPPPTRPADLDPEPVQVAATPDRGDRRDHRDRPDRGDRQGDRGDRRDRADRSHGDREARSGVPGRDRRGDRPTLGGDRRDR